MRSRPPGPGFGPRLLRTADAFPAKEELQALIDAIPAAWPDLGDRIETRVRGDTGEDEDVLPEARTMALIELTAVI